MMVKNEEDSIVPSITSLPPAGVHTLIVYDTGSTDRTLAIIRDLCTTHHIQLYLKQASEPFHDFATSRNESLDFADTVDGVQYVIMMDAGDELRCRSASGMHDFHVMLQDNVPLRDNTMRSHTGTLGPRLELGIVTLSWLEENSAKEKDHGQIPGPGELTEHYDIRFVRTRCGHRYQSECPVHETFARSNDTETTFQIQHWYLYQNRLQWGKSTCRRFQRDLELLHAAPPTARNLFYLGQTYIATSQYVDGYIYNLRALVAAEKDRKNHIANIRTLYERIAVCALECQTPPPTFLPYLYRAIEYPHTPSIEAALNLMRYALNSQQPELAEPYLTRIAAMEKIPGECVNHANYDYTRWWLLYKMCMMLVLRARYQGSDCDLGLWMDLGRRACKRVLEVRPTEEDRQNYMLFLMNSLLG
jgi:glycosyltransferase involved in cell wall biosynthesis